MVGAQRLAGLDGVLGTLLDLVEVDEGWEPAFEAAAGEAMLAVVVDEPSTAAKALRHLMEGDSTGAVLALRRPSGVVALSPVVGGELVRRHVRARDGCVDGLLDSLLATVFRVDGWEQAVEIAASNPAAVVVTPDGHRFSATGWRLGAAGGGATAAALDDARSRADSASAPQRREADIARTRGRSCAWRFRRRPTWRGASTPTTPPSPPRPRRWPVSKASVGRARSRSKRSSARCPRSPSGATACSPASPNWRCCSPARGRRGERDGSGQGPRRRPRPARGPRRVARLAPEDLEVRNAGLHDRHDYLQHRLEENERRLAADVAARAEAEQHRSKIERALGAIDRLASLVEGHRATIEGEHGRLQEIRRRQSDEVRALAERLDLLRRSRTDAERSTRRGSGRNGQRSTRRRYACGSRQRSRRCAVTSTPSPRRRRRRRCRSCPRASARRRAPCDPRQRAASDRRRYLGVEEFTALQVAIFSSRTGPKMRKGMVVRLFATRALTTRSRASSPKPSPMSPATSRCCSRCSSRAASGDWC